MAGRSVSTDKSSIRVKSTDENFNSEMSKENDTGKNVVLKSGGNVTHIDFDNHADDVMSSLVCERDTDKEELFVGKNKSADSCSELSQQSVVQNKKTCSTNDAHKRCENIENSKTVGDDAVLTFGNNCENVIERNVQLVSNEFFRLRDKSADISIRNRMKPNTMDEVLIPLKSQGKNLNIEIRKSGAKKVLDQSLKYDSNKQSVAGESSFTDEANSCEELKEINFVKVEKTGSCNDDKLLKCENIIIDNLTDSKLMSSTDNESKFEFKFLSKTTTQESLKGKCAAIKTPYSRNRRTKRLKVEPINRLKRDKINFDKGIDDTPMKIDCNNSDFNLIDDSKAILSISSNSESMVVNSTLSAPIQESGSGLNQSLKRKQIETSTPVSTKCPELIEVDQTDGVLFNVKCTDDGRNSGTIKEQSTIKDLKLESDQCLSDVQSDGCDNQRVADNSSAVKDCQEKVISFDLDEDINNITVVDNEKIDHFNDELNGDKSMKIESETSNDKIVFDVSNNESTIREGTPSLSGKIRKTHIARRMRNKCMATSTPCTSGKRSERSSLVGSSYKPPARSVIEKWKPSLMTDGDKPDCSLQLSSTGIENISVIENPSADTSVKSATISLDGHGETSKHDKDFEGAFQSLYVTLFSCGNVEDGKSSKDDQDGNPNDSNISKLELYRDNIVQLHKRDNEKLDEIISEISTLSNRHFITVDEIIGERSVHDLSTVTEDESEVSDDKTVIFVDEKATDKTLCDKHTIEAAEDDKNHQIEDQKSHEVQEPFVNENYNKESTLKDELDIEKGIEGIEVPVINGANSIVYLNTKELTLDEENALLNSDNEDDVISLVCSDIVDLTPSGSIVNLSEISTAAKQPYSVGEPITNKLESQDVDIAVTSGVCKTTSDLNNAVVVKNAEAPVPPVEDRNLPFISSDPKENEDNNDPEWEHLRRLNNDKDRYKALRKRWRSVVIPDPNLDLTSQTYRQKKLMKSVGETRSSCIRADMKTPYLVNNDGNKNSKKRTHAPPDSQDLYSEPARKKRKCTTLFEENIQTLVKRLEFKRYCLYQEMNKTFADLACKQEEDVYNCQMTFCNRYMVMKRLKDLHFHHLKQVENVRQQYMTQLAEAEQQMQEYVDALRAASEEVNTFHKFYEDLNSNNNSGGSMYLTDGQFQELVETENMLDLYSKFYN